MLTSTTPSESRPLCRLFSKNCVKKTKTDNLVTQKAQKGRMLIFLALFVPFVANLSSLILGTRRQ